MPEKKRFEFPTLDGQPLISISIFQNKEYVDLKFPVNQYRVTDLSGQTVFKDLGRDRIWRVKVKEGLPPVFEYYILVQEAEDADQLESRYKALRPHKGITEVADAGAKMYLKDDHIATIEKYQLKVGPFENQKEARQWTTRHLSSQYLTICRKLVQPGKGVLEIFDVDCEYFREVENGLKFIPEQFSNYFELQRFDVTEPNEEKRLYENIKYPGALDIMIDGFDTQLGINRVPVEYYLEGMLCSEAGHNAPEELIKTLAVIGRSQIFSGISSQHQGEVYDFCNRSHCLKYQGKKTDDVLIKKAVHDTKGLVLTNKQNICDPAFSHSCGGHTEHAPEQSVSNWQGVFDGEANTNTDYDLKKEQDVKAWILGRPQVNCNLNAHEHNCVLEDNVDAFRWEVFYTRTELEEIVRKKTGEQPGVIYEIIPLERGISGRISDIEILGSLKNIRIRDDWNIRSAFSDTLLNSACFFVETQEDDDGVPINFLFIGAGKGHGIGLCKVGAAMMACHEKTMPQILQHYYGINNLRKIY